MYKRTGGFTLIELLVVVFIISIVTSVAVLTVGRNERKQVESFANELTQLVSLAEEQAVLRSNVLGLSLHQDYFQFSHLQLAKNGAQQDWKPYTDTVLGKRFVPDDIEVGINVGDSNSTTDDDDSKPKKPQIIISSNGDVTPFSIYIGQKGKKPRYVISGDTDGNVTTKELT